MVAHDIASGFAALAPISTDDADAAKDFGGLAVDAAHNKDRSEAELWLERGRQAESSFKRSAHALAWELLDVEIGILERELASA